MYFFPHLILFSPPQLPIQASSICTLCSTTLQLHSCPFYSSMFHTLNLVVPLIPENLNLQLEFFFVCLCTHDLRFASLTYLMYQLKFFYYNNIVQHCSLETVASQQTDDSSRDLQPRGPSKPPPG